MAIDAVGSASSAGRAVGRTMGGASNVLAKAATRTREEAEDIWSDAKDMARKEPGRDAAIYGGIAATTALGVVELPLAAAIGAGYAILRRRR